MHLNHSASLFKELQNSLTLLEQNENRLNFLLNMAYSYLDFNQKEFIKILKNAEIDAAAWNQISNLFDEVQNSLIPGQRTFNSHNIDNRLHEIGLGMQSIGALVTSLYFSNQWADVCYQYAKDLSNNSQNEINDIIKDYEQKLDVKYHL